MSTLVTFAAAKSGDSGNFLVTPGLGLMIWTLIAFGITFLLLRKLAFPRIAEALDKRRRAIDEAIDAPLRARPEAGKPLQEDRARLTEARQQAEDNVARPRQGRRPA